MTETDPVRISECRHIPVDEYGDRSPGELHNYSDRSIDLKYYYLSDNLNNLDKWRLPIGGWRREYLVIFLSGQDAVSA